MAGKISLFSIINDYTMPPQFKDTDIMSGFQNKLKSQSVEFDKLNKSKFVVIHSQCSVKYDVEGFK
jgi:myosin heavy subunit